MIKKSVNWQASSAQISIFIDTVSQIILLLVHITNIA